MQYLSSDDEDYHYTDAVFAKYEEGVEWLDWIISLEVDDPCFVRGVALRSIFSEQGTNSG